MKKQEHSHPAGGSGTLSQWLKQQLGLLNVS